MVDNFFTGRKRNIEHWLELYYFWQVSIDTVSVTSGGGQLHYYVFISIEVKRSQKTQIQKKMVKC